jgi:hypothetical protein
MTPVEALKNIKTLIDGSEHVVDASALRTLLGSIKVMCEQGTLPSVRPARKVVSETKHEGGAEVLIAMDAAYSGRALATAAAARAVECL